MDPEVAGSIPVTHPTMPHAIMLSRALVRTGSLLGLLLLTSFPVLSDSPDASGADTPDVTCESAEACFLAAVSFADAHPDQGLLQAKRFRRVHEAYPGTPWARRAGFRAGWALLDHDPAQALEYLRVARRDFPLLEDYVLLKLGQALGRLDAHHDAATAFDEALALSPPSVLHAEILYEAGFAWFADGRCHEADDRLRRAASRDPDSLHAPRALSMRATCAERLHREADAIQALREIWWHYPESPEARAVNDIVRSGQASSLRWEPATEDYYRRGKTLYDLARFEKAIQDLQTFVDRQPGSPEREKGLFQLGMAHVRLKQYPQAVPLFRQLTGTTSDYTGTAAVWLATVYLRQDQGRLLLALRDAEMPALPAHDRDQIQWLSGVWAEDHNKVQDAIAAYEHVSRVADLLTLQRRALWRLGWVQYQQGAWEDARDHFRMLAMTVQDHDWQRRAHYWHARTLERMGQGDEAQTWYRRVATEWPVTYYGQLSQARLRVPVNVADHRRVQWEKRAMARPALSVLRTNVRFQKASALSRLGLREEAAGELFAIGTSSRGQPRILYAVAQQLMEFGAYDAALSIAVRNFLDDLQRHHVPPDSPLWRMTYPAGYVHTIRDAAAPHVDPFLVAGLIREESLYNPRALSSVGAAGLMQLMPETANRVARRLGLGPVDRDDLFDGALNIRLGTYHVGELLDTYQGNEIHAIAAYNAGPKVVQRWIDEFGDRDPDEFVERIPYKETRRYVKRVITSYRVYCYLYATACSAFHLDRPY